MVLLDFPELDAYGCPMAPRRGAFGRGPPDAGERGYLYFQTRFDPPNLQNPPNLPALPLLP